MSRQISTSVDVLLGDEDEEHVGQQLVLDVHGVALHGVILFKVDLAGLAVVVGGQVAEVAGRILDKVGDGNAALRSDRAHLFLELFFARGSEAGERLVVDGLFARDHLGEVEHAVGGGDLVGVDVGIHHGHADLVELAGLDLREHGVRVCFGLLGQREPLAHARLAVSHDQIGHITARGGLAHGEFFHVETVFRAVCHDRIELLVDLPHGVEVFIRRNLDRCGADRLAAIFGRQVEVTAQVDVVAAVHMGHAVVGCRLAGSAVGGVEVVIHVEAHVEDGLAVFLACRQLDVCELVLVLALGHPAVKIPARVSVGEQLLVDIGAGVVTLQRERDGTGADGRGECILRHAGHGDGEGHVLAVFIGDKGDGRVDREFRSQQRIVLGVHVLVADGERGRDRERERHYQGHQQRERFADRVWIMFHGFRPPEWSYAATHSGGKLMSLV